MPKHGIALLATHNMINLNFGGGNLVIGTGYSSITGLPIVTVKEITDPKPLGTIVPIGSTTPSSAPKIIIHSDKVESYDGLIEALTLARNELIECLAAKNPYIVIEDMYSVELCRENKDTLFVFGDNLIGIGKGGQAVIRGESNVFGIPTKVFPLDTPYAYLNDQDSSSYEVYMQKFYTRVFEELAEAAKDYDFVAFPVGGLGTGLAYLPENAPRLLAYIDKKVSALVGGDYASLR